MRISVYNLATIKEDSVDEGDWWERGQDAASWPVPKDIHDLDLKGC